MRAAQVGGAILIMIAGFSGLVSDSSLNRMAMVLAGIALLVSGSFPAWFSANKHLCIFGYSARFTGMIWGGVVPVLVLSAAIGAEDQLIVPVFWLSGLAAIVICLYATTVGRTRIVFTKHEIKVDSALAENRIAVLSDLHLGDLTNLDQIRNAVELTNSANPDLVILAGDLIDADGRLTDDLVAELERLNSDTPVIAVLGNHEITADEPNLITTGLHHSESIKLLRDDFMDFQLDTENADSVVRVVGVDPAMDWWDAASESRAIEVVGKSLEEPPSFVIVACHHPDGFESISKFNVDVMVSGHTHGGQLAIPGFRRIANIGALATSYLWGKYELNSTQLIVSAGIGVGIVPMRLGVNPEVTLIDLATDT